MATFPTSPGISECEITSNQGRHHTTGKSKRSQSRDMGPQLIEASIKIPEHPHSNMAAITAFCASQRGNPFQIALPPHSNTNGNATGTAKVNGSYAKGDTVIRIDGFPSGQANTLMESNFITFASHNKAYMIEDTVSAGSGALLLENGDYLLLENGDKLLLEEDGQIEITIYPGLKQAISNDEVVTYNNVQFTMALKNYSVPHSTKPPQLNAFSANLIEHWN